MRTLIKFLVMFFLLLLPFALYTPSASAAPAITVVNNADSGPGSLRQAIADLDSGGTITFDPILNGQTITLITGELTLAQNMTIDGGTGITISGNSASRVFNITGGTITLNALTIAGGNSSNGGGISNAGTLTCTSCNIISNLASNNGGGIYNTGTLTCTACIINFNTASSLGGGLYNLSPSPTALNNCTVTSNSASNGGGISNAGTLTCTFCSIGGNSASMVGGGLYNPNPYTMTLNSCTLNNNSADLQGGGAANFGTFAASSCTFSVNLSNNGGGLYNASPSFTLSFCTFFNNIAYNNGGGIGITGQTTIETCTFTGNQAPNGGAVFCSANSTFRNCTFRGNSSAAGSALNITAPIVGITNCTLNYNLDSPAIFKGANTLTILNCIIWNNTAAVSNPTNTTVSFSDIQGGWAGTGSNNIMADPLLGVLANNGSPIQTMALLPGSPCINTGFAAGAPALDARGVTRDPQVDMGAFESRGFIISIDSGNNQSAFVNTDFASPLQVLVASSYSEPVNGGIVTFSPPGSGASAVITGTPATIASGSASVTAAANGTAGGPYTVSAAAIGANTAGFNLTNTTPMANLSITKSHTGSIISGENTSYTITVTNNGPNTATSVSMADTLPTGTTFVSLTASPGWTCTTPAVGAGGTVSGSITSLASGASATFTLTINVTAAPDTTISNTVTISSSTTDPTPGNNSATSSGTVIAPPSADVSITKSYTGSLISGENASYTITATNNGPDAATSVSMSDTLPAGTTFVSLSQTSGPTWSCTTPAVGAGGTVSGSITSLASGASATFTLTINVTAAPDTTLSNTVTISSSTTDPTLGNNSSTSSGTVVAPPSADVSITKSYTGSLISGGNVSYTIIVTNTGPDTAAAVTMADTLPTGTTFVSLTASPGWSCTTPAVDAGGTVSGSIASLASGASASFTLSVKVTATPDTVLANTATVSSSTADPSPGNNSSTSSGTVIASADLAITKTHSGDFTAGASAAYTITVTNNGPSTANSVSMSDTLPTGTTFVSLSAPGGWSCTTPAIDAGGTVTGSIASLASGASAVFTLTVNVTAAPDTTLSNTVTISSSTTDPTPGNNSSTSSGTVVAPPSADVSITKSHTGDLISGENAVYTITVTNTGPDTATTVSMSDTLPAGTTFMSLTAPGGWSCTTPLVDAGGTVTGSIASLASSASAVFTLTVKVDAAAGTEISNTATVASTTSDPNGSNNTSTDTATVLSPGSPGVTVDPVSLNVNETGANVAFTVCLDTYPTGSVTIPVSSSDTSEITVSPATLTFTSGNWSTPQTVTVSPVDDGVLDGSQTATVVLGPATSTDTNYNALDPADVAVTVLGPSSGGGGGGGAPISPTVTTKSASPVSQNSAILQGSIGSGGTAKIDKYGFMYGNQCGNLDKQAIVGTSDRRGDFSLELTGLNPGQTYFFKAYTLNNNGQMISGSTLSFTTNKAEVPVPTPVKQKFSDVPSTYWAYAAINQLVEKGCINGYGNGTFRPDSNITRAEFITILVKAMNLKSAAPMKTFTDTAGHWAKADISTVAALGISTGYIDGSFKPNALITREEMAIMVLKAAKLMEASGETSFSDNDQISNWAKGSVLAAVNNQLMNGYPDNTFRPRGYTTRAEAVSVIVKLIK